MFWFNKKKKEKIKSQINDQKNQIEDDQLLENEMDLNSERSFDNNSYEFEKLLNQQNNENNFSNDSIIETKNNEVKSLDQDYISSDKDILKSDFDNESVSISNNLENSNNQNLDNEISFKNNNIEQTINQDDETNLLIKDLILVNEKSNNKKILNSHLDDPNFKLDSVADNEHEFISSAFELDDDFQKRIEYSKKYNNSSINKANIVFKEKDYIEKNLYKDILYTKKDLDEFKINLEDTIKFFKNGSVYFKLKDPDYFEKKINKVIFKKDTKFSNNNYFTNTNPIFKDLLNNINSFEASSIFNDHNSASLSIRQEIFDLNKKLEEQLEIIEQYSTTPSDIELVTNAHVEILENQKALQKKIYSLRQDYVNSSIIYRIQNLYFSELNDKNLYFGHELDDFNFDIYALDRIVIISDDSVTNLLLIDVLRGDEQKTNGYIFKNLIREQKWIDVDNNEYDKYKIESMNLDEEIIYNLTSPDYFSFASNKKSKVEKTINKILKTLSIEVDNDFQNNLFFLLKFTPFLNSSIFELDDLNIEKFITICDILIGKKVILIKNICQGMSHNEKIDLFTFLNKYFSKKRITVIYASDDYLEANLLANKVMVIKNGRISEFKNVEEILTVFETIDSFILHNLKYT